MAVTGNDQVGPKAKGDIDLAKNIVRSVKGQRIVISASGAPATGRFKPGDICLDYGTPAIGGCTVGGLGTGATWKWATLS